MDHQIQSLVLINDEWVSRPLDVYQIMARAQQQNNAEAPKPPPTIPSPEVPQLGVLSRTVFASPMNNIILPASIRNKGLTDVILVGENSLQLKEIRDYGQVHHVASKSDFKGRILAASVFGDLREMPRVPLATSIGSPNRNTLHRGRASLGGNEDQLLPPEVIVLTLACRTLVFLWARSTSTGAVSFVQKTIKLPVSRSRFDLFGTHLAIDPKRRAIAVAAQEGSFALYKTKSMHEWRRDIRAGENVTPIEDDCLFPIEGRIMFMDFLSSNNDKDDFHVILLFVVAHQGKTKLTCFDWDCRQDLSKATARTERVLLDFGSYSSVNFSGQS